MKEYIAKYNNCLQCCVAGILDLELEDVINFYDGRKGSLHWLDFLATYLEAMHGVRCHVLDPERICSDPTIGIYHKEGDPYAHAVIMAPNKREVILHDPWPDEVRIAKQHLVGKIRLVREEICFQTPN